MGRTGFLHGASMTYPDVTMLEVSGAPTLLGSADPKQATEFLLEQHPTALQDYPLLSAWLEKMYVCLTERRPALLSLSRRALEWVTKFFGSDKRKKPNAWQSGDPYYESVVRTLPEILAPK